MGSVDSWARAMAIASGASTIEERSQLAANSTTVISATTVASALCHPITLYGFRRNDLWDHSAACAHWSRAIAEGFELWDRDVAYLAGLLHDIGLPALEKFVQERSSVRRLIRTAEYPPFAAEQMVLGFDHAYLGKLICESWSVQLDVVAAVAAHHEPFAAEAPSRLAAIVHLADAISLAPEARCYKPFFSIEADPRVIQWLGLGLQDLDQIVARLRSRGYGRL